ncbi:hypothetical protein C8R44DRAFT_783880 [Mycena epipterygia]|nr:hypothetical protein C8R44DRAFT_783880 [Mycena epipterygia]
MSNTLPVYSVTDPAPLPRYSLDAPPPPYSTGASALSSGPTVTSSVRPSESAPVSVPPYRPVQWFRRAFLRFLRATGAYHDPLEEYEMV